MPDKIGRLALRHVIEVRHDSFCTGEFITLLRQFKMPVVYTDHAKYPNIADLTGEFVYARLQRGDDAAPTAYPPKDIAAWAKRLRTWADGKRPDDLPHIEPSAKPATAPRDVFAYVIHEGKIAPSRRHGADRAAERLNGRRPVHEMLTATSDLARVHPASPIETVAVPQRSPFGLNTASG